MEEVSGRVERCASCLWVTKREVREGIHGDKNKARYSVGGVVIRCSLKRSRGSHRLLNSSSPARKSGANHADNAAPRASVARLLVTPKEGHVMVVTNMGRYQCREDISDKECK